MKAIIIALSVWFVLLSVPVSAADSTRLFLHSNVVRVGDTSVTLVVMAKNDYALDIAAMQNLLHFPKWLSLIDLVVLKKDGSRNSDAFYVLGKKKHEQDGYISQEAVFASTAAVPKLKADSIAILKVVFAINKAYKLSEGEVINLSADSVVLSSFRGEEISCSQAISLALKIAKAI